MEQALVIDFFDHHAEAVARDILAQNRTAADRGIHQAQRLSAAHA
jgi:hypothetical protein